MSSLFKTTFKFFPLVSGSVHCAVWIWGCVDVENASIIFHRVKVSYGNQFYLEKSIFFSKLWNYLVTPHLTLSEYDLVSPYEVDRNGNYVSQEITHPQRRKRALARPGVDSLHLRLKGFRHDFHMELRTASHLVAPGFLIQTLGRAGTKSVQAFPPEEFCFYQGSLRSHKNSSVALSTCKGLVSTALATCSVAAGTVMCERRKMTDLTWNILAHSSLLQCRRLWSIKAGENCQVISLKYVTQPSLFHLKILHTSSFLSPLLF